VAELYLEFPIVAAASLRAMRAFDRVHLKAGASAKLRFQLVPRNLSMATEVGEPNAAEHSHAVSAGGGQSHTGVQEASGAFDLNRNAEARGIAALSSFEKQLRRIRRLDAPQ
jgi:beta-glucosidase